MDASKLESQWVLDLLQRVVPVKLSMHVVRKLAHFTEFAVLWRKISDTKSKDT